MEASLLGKGIQYIAHERALCRNPQTAILQQTENILPILSGPTIKHVMFLRKYKDQPCFVDTTF
jgi:hypothetical protein